MRKSEKNHAIGKCFSYNPESSSVTFQSLAIEPFKLTNICLIDSIVSTKETNNFTIIEANAISRVEKNNNNIDGTFNFYLTAFYNKNPSIPSFVDKIIEGMIYEISGKVNLTKFSKTNEIKITKISIQNLHIIKEWIKGAEDKKYQINCKFLNIDQSQIIVDILDINYLPGYQQKTPMKSTAQSSTTYNWNNSEENYRKLISKIIDKNNEENLVLGSNNHEDNIKEWIKGAEDKKYQINCKFLNIDQSQIIVDILDINYLPGYQQKTPMKSTAQSSTTYNWNNSEENYRKLISKIIDKNSEENLVLELLNDKKEYNVIIEVDKEINKKSFTAHSVVIHYHSSYFGKESENVPTNKKHVKIIKLKELSVKLESYLIESKDRIYHSISNGDEFRDDLNVEEIKIWDYVIKWRIAHNPTLPADSKEWFYDKFIQDAQLNANYPREVIEWIPHDKFKDVKQIGKGGFVDEKVDNLVNFNDILNEYSSPGFHPGNIVSITQNPKNEENFERELEELTKSMSE
ncbi:hypothetical protein Glove_164g41 [Diversispora epigaea]|uniref:BTB domain-containing protein n=1 Tax=Diversispora epigaea TaxID=1348612 RepID=A0A397ITW5_9GLOM|nr:hypothetical protein Glove_164g41 [Diversispora epigaea]